MERINKARNTANNTEAIVISDLLLFLQRFRQAILKYSFMAQIYGIPGYFTFFMFCWEKKFSSIG